jgi:methionyl-tRNA formyltransferase
MTNASLTPPGGTIDGLRVVVYSVLPPAFQVLQEWVKRHEHKLALVVTSPGPSSRRMPSYSQIVAMCPPGQDVLVTTRPRRTAPLIAALAPDLVVSFSFPYRIPPEVTSIPRFGAVNLHPAPLPRYRGPNPARAIFDGAPTLGATLHRTEADFDTGAILSRHERPMPADVTAEQVFPAWRETMVSALEEGTRLAIEGAPGVPQDHAGATYAGEFTDEDRALDWNLPARSLQCRVTALSLFGGAARAPVNGRTVAIARVTPVPGVPAPAAPGTVLARVDNVVTICTADGIVQALVADA